MAPKPKLKVYRTPIGFHDAYVAAPSQKAALTAWGADRDLFARGVAEQVTDPELMAEPLAKPGTVVRRLRGSAEEQMAAAVQAPERPAEKRQAPPKRKPPPRPSRDRLDRAEAALAKAETAQQEEMRALTDRIAALERERRALDREHEATRNRLESTRDKAAADYEAAIEKWRKAAS